jgi:FtsP/CotA-like multicopper oxidase with cupredoxin domain
MKRTSMFLGTVLALAGTSASAQLGAALDHPNQPVGPARQANFPYAGQCYTAAPVDGLPACTLANARSFACAAPGISNQSAFSSACGAVTTKGLVNPIDPASQPKFQWEVLNPLDYTPVTTDASGKDLGYDYYEIAVHEAEGFQAIASAGLFPNPQAVPAGGSPFTPVAAGVPNGAQWTGLVCPPDAVATGLACTPGAPLFTPIWGVGQMNLGGGPVTKVLSTLGLFKPAAASPWSANNYIATWPSISIRGTTGRPVRVRWINEFPNNHLFCPHPEAADWPCAIDRTFMGVKASIDPQKAPATFNAKAGLPSYGLNQYGSPMQPDNSWVTHLHGGEIPPSVDGFAEKWFGNRVTGALYSPNPFPLNPAFTAPYEVLARGDVPEQLKRPGGTPSLASADPTSWMHDTYTYPMVNGESTIWFHDHSLGKTHHTVIAGPAGFFPVKDPTKHNAIVNGTCQISGKPVACEYTWLDPVSEPRDALGIPLYDLFLAIQDRTFSDDGTIDFSNGLGQPVPPPAQLTAANYPACLVAATPGAICSPPGASPHTSGVNPEVHPTWVPEYFGDHSLVNGVLWPKKTVSPGWYRIRLVDGSDARCYTLGLGTVEPGYATATAAALPPVRNVAFQVIANEQGYLPKAVTSQTSLTVCPGERYELLVNFGGSSSSYLDPMTGNTVPAAPLAGQQVFMSNTAAAPFPTGVTPQEAGSTYAHLASVMRFDVLGTGTAAIPGVPSCAAGRGATWPGTATTPKVACMSIPAVLDLDYVDITSLSDCARDAKGQPITSSGPCIAAERQMFLNEHVDGTTLGSMGMQINGVPFEYDVTETPRQGTYERWKVINTTVDAHPIHPHLIRAQIVSRQPFAKGSWLTSLCGSSACEPAAAPGGVPMVSPDIGAYLTGAPVAPIAGEAGWKDAMVALPGQVLTFVAKWDGAWKQPGLPRGDPRSCKQVDNVTCFDPVTSGPYVWHCHINSHEDSEMMRTSLVVK